MFNGNHQRAIFSAAAAATAATTESPPPPLLPPSSESGSCCMNPFVLCNNSTPWSDQKQLQQQQQQQPRGYHQQQKNKRLKTDGDSTPTTNGLNDIIMQHEKEEDEEDDDEDDEDETYEYLQRGNNVKRTTARQQQDDVTETAEFITQKLQEMNFALDNNTNNFTTRKLCPYQKALFLWPKLKYDREFKLMFLRADEYDGIKAAKRLVNYYVQKRVLFGEGRLVKKITIDDLTEDDIEVLKSGFVLELPNKDTMNGRPVFYCNLSKLDSTTMSVESILRVSWYLLMVVLTETEVAQRKGLYSCTQAPSITDFALVAQISMPIRNLIDHCIPVKITALHVFYDAPDMGFWLMKYIPATADRYSRYKMCGHYGSDVEIEYDLLSFGINLDGLLQKVSAGDKSAYLEYVTRRTEIDSKFTEEAHGRAIRLGYVEYPLPSDTLMGRGRPYREWVGTNLWIDLIDQYADMYKDAETRFDKSCVVLHVLEEYKSLSESRFLLEANTIVEGGGRRINQEEEGSGGGPGWKILYLNGPEAKRKVSASIQNRFKILGRSAAAAAAATARAPAK